MTLEEQRARMLKLRLDLINEYLVLEFVETSTGKSFADFLKYKKITRKQFIKGLPTDLQNPPAEGKEALIAYGNAMNQYFINQHLIAMENEEVDEEENEEATESAQYLGKGKVDPDYLPSEVGLMYNCDGCELKKYHNADGQCEGCPAQGSCVEEYENPDVDESDSFHNASGGCGIPPIPPPFPKVKKIKKSVEAWDKYHAKLSKYKTCRADMKKSGKNLSFHILNLSNPGLGLARGSFNQLVKWNVFGMAQYFKQMMTYNNGMFWEQVKSKWYNLGGDPAKLIKAVEEGKGKKPVFKPKGWKPKQKSADGLIDIREEDDDYFNSGYAEAAAIVGGAAAILTAIVPIVNAFKKSKGDTNKDDGLAEYADPNKTGDPGTDPTVSGEPTGDLSTNMKLAIGVPLGLLTVGLLIWGAMSLSKSKN